MSKLSKKINETKSWWDGVKDWFKRSETIFLSRVAVLSGVVTTTVGAMDWSPILNLLSTGTDFSKKQLIWMGIGIIMSGITLEIARRRGSNL